MASFFTATAGDFFCMGDKVADGRAELSIDGERVGVEIGIGVATEVGAGATTAIICALPPETDISLLVVILEYQIPAAIAMTAAADMAVFLSDKRFMWLL